MRRASEIVLAGFPLRTDAKIVKYPDRYADKRGHPVMISAAIAAEFLREPPEAEVRAVINRHADRIEYVEVDDPAIHDDVDDPALYAALLAREACL